MLNGSAQAQSTAGNGHAHASQVGLAQICQTVETRASSLSYLDVFHVLMVATGIMFFLSFVLRANKPKKRACRSERGGVTSASTGKDRPL
jgi:hypothetical protein